MNQPCHNSSGRTVPLLAVWASLPERSWSSSLKHVCGGDKMKAGITQQVKPEDSTECYIGTITDTTLSHLTAKSL